MNSETTLLQLVSRRESLGMPIAILSARSGVKEPTVKRILGGRAAQASFAHVAAVAHVHEVCPPSARTRRLKVRKKASAEVRKSCEFIFQKMIKSYFYLKYNKDSYNLLIYFFISLFS